MGKKDRGVYEERRLGRWVLQWQLWAGYAKRSGTSAEYRHIGIVKNIDSGGVVARSVCVRKESRSSLVVIYIVQWCIRMQDLWASQMRKNCSCRDIESVQVTLT
jgi:hypothetical protein